jgi:DNA-binding transcriptional LysR family regulator
MNFQTMDYFLLLAQKRSFSRAAEELHITQQTLSGHIASLEKELGCQLFIRHVPLELTYGGEVFLRYATSFQANYHSLLHEFKDIANLQSGKLRLGISNTRSRVLLPHLLTKFQLDFPKIIVQVSEDINDTLLEKLLNGNIDLAIGNFPERIPGLELQDFYKEEIVMLISKKLLNKLYGDNAKILITRLHKGENFSALEKCPFLLNNSHNIAGRIGRNIISRANFAPFIKVQSENMVTLMEMCLEGQGACFCPKNFLIPLFSSKGCSSMECFSFKNYDTEYMIRFAWNKEAYQWSIIQEFIKTALNTINSKNQE